ncbi:MAG TPA: dihydrofolate reductase [Bacteroidales bacterium]|nr:dihydrofolate reductase [Bacteroidales bacterium]HRX97238.1 dihydrofolate reductase [Bacteroidales bacterium]
MKKQIIGLVVTLTIIVTACNSGGEMRTKTDSNTKTETQDNFQYFVEKFADLKIMRYQVPGFDELSLEQKKLVYYLNEAALCGRDILFDQNYAENLRIRKTLEKIYMNYTGDRETDNFKNFEIYLKRVWFSNGIHHHYSTDKFFPDFPVEYFKELVDNSPEASFPVEEGSDLKQFTQEMQSLLFDPNIAPKRISLNSNEDMIKNSACNFYENVTQKEAEAFYAKMIDTTKPQPISYGLNSKLVKVDGKVREEVYKVGGLYGPALAKIVYWLDKAAGVAENENQQKAIHKLIEFYQTGDLKTFDEFNILWVEDLESRVDFVNGFTETYGDPMGMKATWESIVNFKDLEATKRTQIISENAQWFEDHSPVDDRFKKKEVKGVTAKVITVTQLGGDCYPSTPIGINLPNADWIRKEHGSKSVTIENITYAYDMAALGNGFLEEFCYSPEEIELSKKYGFLSGNLHTDLHECLGHGSGILLEGTSSEALKNYSSALEEARADLFALYYLMDQKMIDLGIMPNFDVAKTEYNGYIRNGLMTQLARIDLGKNIEQAHMRNRQLISKWCFEKGQADNVIERVEKDGKTFYIINDYNKLRDLFGALLAEVQRIKSEGDYEAGKALVETYGVQIDPEIHKEVKARYEKLNLAPYGGFINPVFKPVYENDQIVDIEVTYTEGYAEQMLRYSKDYSFLN